MNTLITWLIGFCVIFLLIGCDDQSTEPLPIPRETICGTVSGLICPEEHMQYCDFDVGQCKVADSTGICKYKPEVCTQEYNPVCGCDGKTYANTCTAAADGVSVDHPGECEPQESQACGGITGIMCPDGQTCIDDPNDNCNPANGGADCLGECITQ